MGSLDFLTGDFGHEVGGTAWMDSQLRVESHTLTHTFIQYRQFIDANACLWTVGGSQNTQRKPPKARGENTSTSFEANMLTTKPSRCLIPKINHLFSLFKPVCLIQNMRI